MRDEQAQVVIERYKKYAQELNWKIQGLQKQVQQKDRIISHLMRCTESDVQRTRTATTLAEYSYELDRSRRVIRGLRAGLRELVRRTIVKEAQQ